MCNPANHDMSHSEMQSVLLKTLRPISQYIEREYKLPNQKIADIYCEIREAKVILEVKTVLKTSLMESALRKYGTQCDLLIMCTPPTLQIDDTWMLLDRWPSEALDRIGIWHVDWLSIVAARMPRALHSNATGRPDTGSLSPSLCAAIGTPACTAGKA